MKATKRTVRSSREGGGRKAEAGEWTFLTNHSHVLLCLVREPGLLMREIAERVGVTERAVQKIVADLEAAGVLERQREGRRNRYGIDPSRPLRHPVEAHCRVRDLLDLVS